MMVNSINPDWEVSKFQNVSIRNSTVSVVGQLRLEKRRFV